MFAEDLKRFKLTAVLLLFCCHGLIGQDLFSPTDAATRIHESAIHVSGVKTPNGGPVDAVQGIVAAFRRHPVVHRPGPRPDRLGPHDGGDHAPLFFPRKASA